MREAWGLGDTKEGEAFNPEVQEAKKQARIAEREKAKQEKEAEKERREEERKRREREAQKEKKRREKVCCVRSGYSWPCLPEAYAADGLAPAAPTLMTLQHGEEALQHKDCSQCACILLWLSFALPSCFNMEGK